MKPRFIVFEGPDNCGKSTQAAIVAKWLSEEIGVECRSMAEPGSTPLGAQLRRLLLGLDTPISPLAQAMLFCAARVEICALIEQAIVEGAWVVLDRFSYSTIAYQGAGHGIPRKTLQVVDQLSRGGEFAGDRSPIVVGGLFPDLTIVLDVPLVDCIERSGGPDRFESETIEFKSRVDRAYQNFMSSDRLIHVDGVGTHDEVSDRIMAAIKLKFLEV